MTAALGARVLRGVVFCNVGRQTMIWSGGSGIPHSDPWFAFPCNVQQCVIRHKNFVHQRLPSISYCRMSLPIGIQQMTLHRILNPRMSLRRMSNRLLSFC